MSVFFMSIPICGEPSGWAQIKDCVQSGVLLIGLIIGCFQVHAHTKNRRLQSLLAVLQKIENDDVGLARWFAYEHYKDIDALLQRSFANEFDRLRKLDEFIKTKSNGKLDLQKYRHGLQAINTVAFLINKGYVHHSVVPEYLAKTILRTHEYFKGWIKYRRTAGRITVNPHGSEASEGQEASLYCDHLEKLADIIRPGGRLTIDRFVGIRSYLRTLEEFGSTRVGRDVIARIEALEEAKAETAELNTKHMFAGPTSSLTE